MAQRRSKQVQPQTGPEKAFGEVLREIREGRDVSQEQLALDAGFDRTFISLLERGVRSPTLRTLFRLAGHLGVNPSDILCRVEAKITRAGKRGALPPSP